ncbi:unnamed protein product [Calypogeia fissa]
MNELAKMAAALKTVGVPRRVVCRRSLLVVIMLLGLLFVSGAGGSALDSRSPSLFAEDINQPAQPSYMAVSDHGGSRHLLQAISSNTTNATHAPLLLARSRTDRPNPLHGLKTYRGGFNLSSANYGASVGYTGLPAWILALIWTALGLILVLALCFMCCCCRHRTRHEYNHGHLGYILPIAALVLFTLAAIAGSILLYYAQREFNSELTDTMNYAVNQSRITEAGLREVQSNLSAVVNLDIDGIIFSASDQATIASLNTKLNNTANDLHSKTWDTRKKVIDAINIVRIVLIVVAAVMLALVLSGLLFAALGVRWLVYLLILVGWVLVFATWILCGIFIFLDNGIGDTCLAMQEWVANPEANTSLDKFLPCNGAAAAAAIPLSAGYTNQIVNYVNDGIRNQVNRNLPLGSGGYNQSGPLVPTLCSRSTCANNTTTLEAAPTFWARYVCVPDSSGQICTTQGRLTPTLYSQLSAAAEAGDSLFDSTDFLVNAANCTFVRKVFTNIDQHRCHDLRLHSRWIWIGLILVSAGNMSSILLWIVFIRRKRYRYYKNKQQQMEMYKGQSQPYSPPPPASSAA